MARSKVTDEISEADVAAKKLQGQLRSRGVFGTMNRLKRQFVELVELELRMSAEANEDSQESADADFAAYRRLETRIIKTLMGLTKIRDEQPE